MADPRPGRRLRRLGMGLATVLGLAPQGWFIPHRYAGSVRAPDAYPELEGLFAAARPRLAALLDEIESRAAALAAIGRETPRPATPWSARAARPASSK